MSGIRYTRRVAEETQLLAEEKWVTEALNKVKKQRNCLQIERLHLEGMKAQLKIELDKKGKENKPDDLIPDISITNIQKPTTEFEVLDEECCNKEELDLAVNNNLFGNTFELPSFSMVEEEEEEEDDDDSSEDVFIDMNMFMNGGQLSKKRK